MPRPLYINFSKGWGGLELFSANLFEWMSNEYEITFIVNGGSPLHEHLSDSDYSEHVIAVKARRYFSPKALRVIKRTVGAANIDLIHTFTAGDLYHATRANQKPDGNRAKVILHLQMLPHSSRQDLIHKWLYRRLDLLLTITRQMQERVRQLWPVRPEIVRPLYYGINVERFSTDGIDPGPVKRRHDIAENARVVGIIGNICKNKGQRFVLEVFHELTDLYPDLVMLMAGGIPDRDAPYADGILQYITEHQLEGCVRILEFTKDVAALLSTFDIFVLGSVAEAFGFVVIEAMAAGRVVVASRAGGVPEIITDGVDGFLYESQDPGSLKAALQKALDLQPEARAQLVRNAKTTVAERFSHPRMIRDICDVYEEIVS